MQFVLITLLPLSHPGITELHLDFVPTQSAELPIAQFLVLLCQSWRVSPANQNCCVIVINHLLQATGVQERHAGNAPFSPWLTCCRELPKAKQMMSWVYCAANNSLVSHSPVYCKWVTAEVESSFRDECALRLPLKARVQPLGCLVIL